MLETAYQLTRTDGVTMLISGTESGLQHIVESRAIALRANRDGVSGDYREPSPLRQIPRYIKLANAGKLKLKELITDSVSLDDINTVVEKMRNGELTGTVYHRTRRELRRDT